MRKFIFLLSIAALVAACANEPKGSSDSKDQKETKDTAATSFNNVAHPVLDQATPA